MGLWICSNCKGIIFGSLDRVLIEVWQHSCGVLGLEWPDPRAAIEPDMRRGELCYAYPTDTD